MINSTPSIANELKHRVDALANKWFNAKSNIKDIETAIAGLDKGADQYAFITIVPCEADLKVNKAVLKAFLEKQLEVSIVEFEQITKILTAANKYICESQEVIKETENGSQSKTA